MIDDIRGIASPFHIDQATGRVAWAQGAEKLRQNVRITLTTRIGERPMLRDFGTNITALVHEPNDDIIGDLLQKQARQALLLWEPRVLVTGIQMQQDPEQGEARLQLNYIHTEEPIGGQMTLPIR